jgi:pimeloyl-ACP methyl ester carboxylesterase
MTIKFRETSIDVQGLKLHCLQWGDPPGEPVVLVHGFLDQAYSWRPFVEALQHRAKNPLWIIAPDCRGHGDSGWIGAGGYYHFPDYVNDLDCLLRALGIRRLKLIGHSMGGTISFLYSGTFPTSVSRLVLIEGLGPVAADFAEAPKRMEKWITELRERGRHHFRDYPTVAAGARQLQQTHPRLNHELALELALAGMKQNANAQWVWKFDPLHRTTSPQPFYSQQAIEFLRRIQCPVLLVEGKHSHHARRPEQKERLDAIKDKSSVEIEDAGHMIHHDNPEALAAVVAAFLVL